MGEAPKGIPPMVHAVAEALRADCLRTFGAAWSYDVSWAFARAAIEAMREPTDEMIIAGSNFCGRDTGAATFAWKAMVNAALAEPPSPR
jgi:hypothetical protein